MTTYACPGSLAETAWLAERIGALGLRVIEVDEGITAYHKGHIPGAIGWNWLADLHTTVGRDHIDQAALSGLLAAAGVDQDTTVILYGGHSNRYAAYAYWIVNLRGFDAVRLLNGGRKKWELESRELVTEVPQYPRTGYQIRARERRELRAHRDEVLAAAGTRTGLVDVRSPEEYRGKKLEPDHLPGEQAQAEPRRPGRATIPGFNIRAGTVCEPQTTTKEEAMTLAIGDTVPDFQAQSTEGRISFHEWIGDSWAVLFSHPKDFTPVCTTELGYMAKVKPEFDRRGVKIIGLSVDATTDPERWAADIEETQGHAPNYPIIGDADYNVAKLYGMLPASTSGDARSRTPADNQTVRNVFVIGPDKKVKLILVYPMTTGRNFDEVLRVIDSLQLTVKHKVSTPVNWKRGEDVIIAGSVNNEQAKELFGTWKEPKPYIRIVPQPG